MIVSLHDFRGSKYFINTDNINCVHICSADSKTYAEEIAESGGGPLSFIYIDWHCGTSSTRILVSSETAEEFLPNVFNDVIELF